MLQFFKDAALKLPVSIGTPKRFSAPLAGGTVVSSVWLGDPYTATVTAQAAIGATTLTLDQTFEFPTSGSAVIGAQTITFTGKTGTSLTGIPANGVGSITSIITVGSLARPKIFYVAGGNITIIPSGLDLGRGIQVALKLPGATDYNFPGTSAIDSVTQIETGVSNARQYNMQVIVAPGAQQEFVSWNLTAIPFQVSGAGNYFAVEASGYAIRRDQALPQSVRVLEADRKVSSTLPGFLIGEYRWRDKEQVNAKELVPASWNIDTEAIGEEKFVTGYGHGSDLEAVELDEVADSLFLRIRPGAYFSGPRRYYLPAQPVLEFLPASGNGHVAYTLQEKPRWISPIYVGTWRLDSQGFYEKDTEYRYESGAFDVSGSSPAYQYTLNRKTKTLTLNTGAPSKIMFLGTLSGKANDYFDLPIYPVDRVKRVYIDRGVTGPQVNSSNYTFDREWGAVVVSDPAGTGPSITGGLAGEAVFAEYDPAVAILYDYGEAVDRLIDEVDINPAFSGVASGVFYLQHRRLRPDTIELSCDKPSIQIPPTFQSILGLVAYGPVYFEGDYALLIAHAYSKVPGESVPGARLQVKVDPSMFTGLINNQDPLTQTIEVVTGADGVANLVYTPQSGYGVWVPNQAAGSPVNAGSLSGKKTTSVSNDTLVLPTPVPISQVHSVDEGWLVTLYSIMNTNPLFGLAGGDPTQGEIPFATTGTVGSSAYKTNGMRNPWLTDRSPDAAVVRPIQALDVNGVNYTTGGFNGLVKQLVYSTALPNDAGTAAYFVTYVQRVTIQLVLAGSNVASNTILLQMEVPSVFFENPWLIIDDDLQGFLNQYRLGWTRALSTRVPSTTP
jgi:hypothetical protein